MSLLIIPKRYKEGRPFDLYDEAGISIGTKVSAKYKVEVCKDGRVIRQPFGDKFLPNLITNIGLDYMMTGQLTVPMTYARIGTGSTTPAVTDTQLVTQTRSTSTLTPSGTSTTTNDTVNGAATHSIQYEFATEGSTVGYNEVGLSDVAGPSASIRTRALFPSTVTLTSGQNMRLTYAITFSTPCIITPISVSLAAVNGFNISGNLKMVGQFRFIFGDYPTSYWGTGGDYSGLSHFGNTSFSAQSLNAFLGSAPTTFPAVNVTLSATVLGSGFIPSLGTYTAGSFTRTYQAIWVPSNPATTVSNVNCIFLTSNAATPTFGLMLLLSSAQTKANTNTLTVNLSRTISRV